MNIIQELDDLAFFLNDNNLAIVSGKIGSKNHSISTHTFFNQPNLGGSDFRGHQIAT